MESLSYKFEVFEGPLDLLLTLIAKNKLNIYDIPITLLLEQYMEQIRRMQEADMDVASEFLEMAARLVHIKSVSLLPKHEEEEELRRELTGQLLEYRQCREAARLLAERFTADSLVRGQADVPVDPVYRRTHDPAELLAAYFAAAGRRRRALPPNPEAFSGLVKRRVVSVASQIVSVLRTLWKRRRIAFSELFQSKRGRSERVAAFLAVLELVRGQRLRVEGEGENPTLQIVKGARK